jgi:transposase
MLNNLVRLIQVEHVDDLPVLWAQIQKMQIPALLDQAFPTHGLWQGELSFGEVAGVWLMFITSQGDHCLSHVQPWAAERLSTLSACVGKPIRPLDFSDDRLAEMLDRLAKTDPWAAVETGINNGVLRVYDLGQPSQPIRIDSTSAKTYAEVDAQGLFQLGHSKDHRPDLPQVKISLSTLDPLGLPLTTTVVSGNCADDPLYVPEIKRVQQTVGVGGKTYIGDCKMGALDTRAWIAQSGDYYLCPLAGKPMPAATVEALLAPVFRGEQPLEPVYDPATIADATPPELLAEGYTVTVRLEGQADGQSVAWSEQRLVVRSIALATRQGRRFDARLEQALVDISRLDERKQGKKILDAAGLNAAAESILQQRRVVGLISLDAHTTTESVPQRRYGGRPAGTRIKQRSTITARLDTAAVASAKQRLGWRIYATNQPSVSLTVVIQAYRGQYVIEGQFGRFKGRSLSLTPLFLQSDRRVVGLIRLLSLALRVLTLVEFTVRRALAQAGAPMAGLYPWQANRTTATPTAELILRAFRGVSLTVIEVAERVRAFLSPMSRLQERLLELLDGGSTDLYERVVEHFQEPALNLSER